MQNQRSSARRLSEKRLLSHRLLLSTEASCALDAEAREEWDFNTFALIEAAGRNCAGVLTEAFPDLFCNRPKITVAAGAGNNGADAMVMLRYWIIAGILDVSSSALIVNRIPDTSENSPRAQLLRSLEKMKVPVLVWNEDIGEDTGRVLDDVLANSDIIIDGIAGTGLKGPLRGTALEMVTAVNKPKEAVKRPGRDAGGNTMRKPPFVVSVDLPSGNSDFWEPGMPIVKADLTLALEPRKFCIYDPAARPYAGIILPAGSVFPEGIVSGCKGAELLDWERARESISPIRPDAYKNERGTVELRAGSPGATGAALIAARGAQAAGAGLIRLVVDDDIYPIIASQGSGVMVVPVHQKQMPGKTNPAGAIDIESSTDDRFIPDAILLGPGWGTKPERMPVLEQALMLEKKGTPLILDADAIALARDKTFCGNVILTPHPGEFSRFSGLQREKLLSHPAPILQKFARERNAVILFKGHVMIIAAPDGRLGVVDGMSPGLAAGGSGDLLAGFCAAIAARMMRMMKEGQSADLYTCASVAASLLIASARADGIKNRFTDPLELADRAADLAGNAWLITNIPDL